MAHANDYLDSLVFRRVDYRYRKHSFRFDLSQSLFSSAGVDGGTHLLLSVLAEETDFARFDRIVDVGCGTGTLGIALAGSAELPLEAYDRDARAVAFTGRNARLNGLDRVQADATLGVPDCTSSGRELVVSNVPAKAGDPVLRSLLSGLARRASLSDGTAAVVIVKPLAAFLAKTLSEIGAATVAEARTANHAAVVFRCAVPPTAADAPDAPVALPREYVRTTAGFTGPAGPYEMQTVYNLPEFDGLSFRTALAFDLLRANRVGGSVLLYGCGQGHLAVGLAQVSNARTRLVATDRDVLALRATQCNARSNGAEETEVKAVPTPASIVDLYPSRDFDWFVVDDDPTPGSRWSEEIVHTADALLDDSGKLLAISRSTSVSRLMREARGAFKEIAERRMHGFRASLLRRKR
ncbi:MAG: methyltransferase [Spirochaetota bacterium]